MIIHTIQVSASEARKQLYSLVKAVGKKGSGYEITLQGSKPVLLISKEDFESWQETFDILMNTKEANDIREASKEVERVPYDVVVEMFK